MSTASGGDLMGESKQIHINTHPDPIRTEQHQAHENHNQNHHESHSTSSPSPQLEISPVISEASSVGTLTPIGGDDSPLSASPEELSTTQDPLGSTDPQLSAFPQHISNQNQANRDDQAQNNDSQQSDRNPTSRATINGLGLRHGHQTNAVFNKEPFDLGGTLPPPLPTPQHFLSRASRRLPELQQHLNLNPEVPSAELDYCPTETDPLFSHSTPDSAHYPSLLPNQEEPAYEAEGDRSQSSIGLSPHRPLSLPRSTPPRKLGTIDGVLIPTVLSLINALYFMRFAYCIGQIGLAGTVGLLMIAYLIEILTVFSLSAIATNGQVRGGGAYYLISRTLGPEFGGSIGVLFCLSQAMTAAMNVIGFVEAFIDIFDLGFHVDLGRPMDANSPSSSSSLVRYLLKSSVLLGATVACIILGRRNIFSSMTRSVTMILMFTLASILLSFFGKAAFSDRAHHLNYTSFSLETFKQNLYPTHQVLRLIDDRTSLVWVTPTFSDYQRVFGIIFPSLSGILAGSSLSGELKKPSKSLPVGMIVALGGIIIIYLSTLFALSMTCDRDSFRFITSQGFLNLIVYQISQYPFVIGAGILLCTLFSSIMGLTICGKILQAVSRDGLIPIFKPFFSQGSQAGDDPVYSIIFCYMICQITLFYSINQIAIHITTISLLVFACINLACFTLRIAGSPNFRPSFRLFSEWTALLGLVLAFLSMYVVDPVSASTSMIAMILLFMVIHYSSPAKQWGEVSQSIIFHQVRKYLLRLDERKDNVKYWRPQILLFTNDPRHDWNQIVFCNSLKKGGLYVLAHIIKSEFSSESIKELQEQQLNWLGLVDISNIKAFVDITLAPDERVGARQLLLTSGLGGMRPNICILGFPTNLKWRGKGKLIDKQDGTTVSVRPNAVKRRSDSSITVRGVSIEATSADPSGGTLGSLPTDSQRSETPIKPVDFVGIIEDSLSLNKSIGLTYGFEGLRLPESISRPHTDERPSSTTDALRFLDQGSSKRWIDLWPILREGESGWETYTMVLQLGTILSMVSSWKKHHELRDDEIAEERRRMEKLMSDLRIRATLRVCVLGNGQIKSYDCLVKGKEVDLISWSKLENTLAGDPWWETLKFMRAQDSPPGVNSTQTKTQRARHPSRAGTIDKKSLNKDLIAKNSQTNNIRIKALHPLSRRGSSVTANSILGSASQDHQSIMDDDEDLILEENDGDDDTIARAAYKRTKKQAPFQGLPDEPSKVKAKTTAHRIWINDYGSTLDHQSLDLQNLSPSSLNIGNNRSGPLNKRNPVGSSSSASSSASTPTMDTARSPADFKKISNRTKGNRGLASALHRKNMTNKNNNKNNPSSEIRYPDGFIVDRPNIEDSTQDCNSGESGWNLETSSQKLPAIELDFNSLPMRAQLICLNELIKFNSNDETAIIFTSLPPPESGSSNNYEGSSRYLDQLESFLDGLPPVLAIWAKQFTVTASL